MPKKKARDGTRVDVLCIRKMPAGGILRAAACVRGICAFASCVFAGRFFGGLPSAGRVISVSDDGSFVAFWIPFSDFPVCRGIKGIPEKRKRLSHERSGGFVYEDGTA